jgi:hypothetical protein
MKTREIEYDKMSAVSQGTTGKFIGNRGGNFLKNWTVGNTWEIAG